MEYKIAKIWFEDGRIMMLTNAGEQRSLPLEVSPVLFYASDEQRNDYCLWDDGRSIRWESLDEDIHISHFFENEAANYDNEVNRLLTKYHYLDVKAFAEYLGMHWTLLERLRFGIVKASAETIKKIREGIVAIGKEMSAAML